MEEVEESGNDLAEEIKSLFQLSAQGKSALVLKVLVAVHLHVQNTETSRNMGADVPFFGMRIFLLFTSLVAAVDLAAVTNMNNTSKTFYAGMNERIKTLVRAAHKVQDHAQDAGQFSRNMAELLNRARRLEALVDRLDEYTSRQEAALAKK